MHKFRDNEPLPKQVKFTSQHSSDSSFRTLCQMVESAVARVEVLERFDEEHGHSERRQSAESDDTMRVSGEDSIRRPTKMLEAVLARISVLEKRRDICYQHAFKAVNEGECLVRGCGAKSSSSKNTMRHFKTTITPEHEIAAIILQQTDCLQCGRQWRTPNGLAHHELTVHEENHSSRIDILQPFLQQSSCKCLHVMVCKLGLMNCSL